MVRVTSSVKISVHFLTLALTAHFMTSNELVGSCLRNSYVDALMSFGIWISLSLSHLFNKFCWAVKF